MRQSQHEAALLSHTLEKLLYNSQLESKNRVLGILRSSLRVHAAIAELIDDTESNYNVF